MTADTVTTDGEEPVTTDGEETVTTDGEETVTTDGEETVTTDGEETVTTDGEEPVTTASEETAAPQAKTKGAFTWGLGRRKSSVARVRVKSGTGNFLVNGKPIDEFFCTLQGRLRAQAPLVTAESEGSYDVFCKVNGGGITGQADAVRLGLARALRKLNMSWDIPFREEGLLTRDARMVERKKYGRRGARRGFQFSKR